MIPKPSASVSNAGFVHLHVHSAYSLLKGSIKIRSLPSWPRADRQPALALTDTDNMFGALEFSDKMAGYGIQPIIGCELAVDFGDQDPTRAMRWPSRRGCAAGCTRARLPQPDAAELAGLSRNAGSSGPPSDSNGCRVTPRA
jgi:DNA polymerase-3 subunit alpha